MKPIKIAIAGLDNTEQMFARIGANFAKVGTATKKLQARFPKLTASFAAAFKALSSTIKSIVKLAGGLSIAFGLAFAVITVQTMKSIDALGKMASKIGSTAGAVAKLNFAAEQTGVSAETMNMAMQRFTRRAAEAAIGTGEAKGALKELNLNAKELIKLPLEEQMIALSKAFEKVETPADKVRLAMKLFDSEGVALVNTLGKGEAGLKAMFSEAEALGLVLSEDAVDGVEAANDSVNKLKKLFVGFSRQAVSAFAPAIDEIAQALTRVGLSAADGDVANVGQIIASSIVSGLATVIKAIESMMNVLGAMAHDIKQTYQNFFPDAEMKKDKDRLNEIVGILGSLERGNSISGKALFADIPALKKELEELRAKMVEEEFVPFNFDKLIEKLLHIQAIMGDTADAAFEQGVAHLNEQMLKGIITAEQFTKAFNILKDELKPSGEPTVIDEIITIGNRNPFQRLISAALDFKDQLGLAFKNVSAAAFDFDASMDSVVTGAIGTITQGFTDAITGAKDFGTAMADMAKSVIDSLIKLFVQYMIVMPLFDMMFPGVRPGSVAAPSVPVVAAIPAVGGTPPPSFDGGGYTGNGARSGGVDGKGGFNAILHPNEQVVDFTKMGSNFSRNTKNKNDAVVVNQTINITTGIQSTVRAEIASLMPQIAQAAKGAVVDARSRGGNFSKAMGA